MANDDGDDDDDDNDEEEVLQLYIHTHEQFLTFPSLFNFLLLLPDDRNL